MAHVKVFHSIEDTPSTEAQQSKHKSRKNYLVVLCDKLINGTIRVSKHSGVSKGRSQVLDDEEWQ